MDGPEPLHRELLAAADAAVGHARKTAATAKIEAQLSAASIAGICIGAVLGVTLLAISWMCVVALGVWLAIAAGWPVWSALLAAVIVNLVGVLICGLWSAKLLPNIGFSRTRNLIVSRGAG